MSEPTYIGTQTLLLFMSIVTDVAVWQAPVILDIATVFVNTTFDVEAGQPALVIVQVNVAAPTTPTEAADVGLAGVATVATPPVVTTLHAPVPTEGVLAANVNAPVALD